MAESAVFALFSHSFVQEVCGHRITLHLCLRRGCWPFCVCLRCCVLLCAYTSVLCVCIANVDVSMYVIAYCLKQQYAKISLCNVQLANHAQSHHETHLS